VSLGAIHLVLMVENTVKAPFNVVFRDILEELKWFLYLLADFYHFIVFFIFMVMLSGSERKEVKQVKQVKRK
jgi:hypothetical protein